MLELTGEEDALLIGPAPLGEAGFAFVLADEIVFTVLPELESAPFEEELFFLGLPRSLLASSTRLWTALEVEGLGLVIVF